MANSLYFDMLTFENDLRKLIKKSIKSKEVHNEFGEIHLVPQDSDLTSDTLFPAIAIYVNKNGVYARTQEDVEIEPFSRFNVQLETYTTGSNRRSLNMKLAQFITYVLQGNQKLEHYYSRGLKLDQDREVSSFMDGVNRRVVRFSGVVNNASKLIYNKEI